MSISEENLLCYSAGNFKEQNEARLKKSFIGSIFAKNAINLRRIHF